MTATRKVHSNTLRARTLRKKSTKEEKILWSYLRNRQIFHYKFRRQFVIEPFIVDFYCDQLKLAVELDGSQHAEDERLRYDQRRTQFLIRTGIQVVRFWNIEITENIECVIEYLLSIIEKKKSQKPHLPRFE